MGELGNKRNNQLAENGLLFDAKGNVFDLTEWYKNNALAINSDELNKQILTELKLIRLHLASMTDETISNEDLNDDT
jgi:hypothetical protein